MGGRVYPPAEERFWARVVFESGPLETQCIVWQGYIDKAGYGQFERTTPHAWAYKRYIGPVPQGKELDHLCRNRSCANFLHLESVVHRQNMERGEPANRTACKRGHPFDAANTYWRRTKFGPARSCKVCRAANLRRFHERRLEREKAGHLLPTSTEIVTTGE